MAIFGFTLLVALVGLTLFQLLLITGKPYGEYAWGGQHRILPRNLRIASTTSIAIYTFMTIIIMQMSGIADIGLSDLFAKTTMWIITGYFGLGIIMNAASRSKKERTIWTPVTAILFILSLLVAVD